MKNELLGVKRPSTIMYRLILYRTDFMVGSEGGGGEEEEDSYRGEV